MTPRERLINELKDRAVRLGLIFTHHQPSFDMSERFTVSSSDQPVLCTSHDLCYIEHYLFGYRDGRKNHD